MYTLSQLKALEAEKHLCYAFIYADGVTRRAWWTLDDITFHSTEKRTPNFARLTIVKALPWLFTAMIYKQVLGTNAHIKAFVLMQLTYT